MLTNVLNIVGGGSFVIASMAFVAIQQRYYSYSRFNLKRLLYIALAGASFAYGIQLLGRTHAFFDPALKLIPVSLAEQIMGICLMALSLHGLSLRERLADDTIRRAGILPEYLRIWRKFRDGENG